MRGTNKKVDKFLIEKKKKERKRSKDIQYDNEYRDSYGDGDVEEI